MVVGTVVSPVLTGLSAVRVAAPTGTDPSLGAVVSCVVVCCEGCVRHPESCEVRCMASKSVSVTIVTVTVRSTDSRTSDPTESNAVWSPMGPMRGAESRLPSENVL